MKDRLERSIEELCAEAARGAPIYLPALEDLLTRTLEPADAVNLILMPVLPGGVEAARLPLMLPRVHALRDVAGDLVRDFLAARVYNVLSTFGGEKLVFYRPSAAAEIDPVLEQIAELFGADRPKGARTGYGRCLNVAERMSDAVADRPPGTTQFVFEIANMADHAAPGAFVADGDTGVVAGLSSLPNRLAGKVVAGLDVGGSDIKVVVAVDGIIVGYKEYDWFPATFAETRSIVEPVLLVASWARARGAAARAAAASGGRVGTGAAPAAADEAGRWTMLEARLDAVSGADAGDDEVRAAVAEVEAVLGEALEGLDALGMCFPDVVVRNKIVGGETYKTRGIRANPQVDYETDFRRLTDLDLSLGAFCRPGAPVRIVNDGPMAAFTAAVEMAAAGDAAVAEGVFAHTLGTELGTGWLDETGRLPELPLEVYNYVIDLGSRDARAFPPDDIRSLNNFNTGLPGTLQKYASQSGVFRLAASLLPGRPDLHRELVAGGFLSEVDGLYVAGTPRDMRKPLLEYLMARAETDADIAEIFRTIGEYMAFTFEETRRILSPATSRRALFGRLVKSGPCFRLMQEGARRVSGDLVLEVADEESAFTPLMRQLGDEARYTVAQFAQAVGAVHYAVG